MIGSPATNRPSTRIRCPTSHAAIIWDLTRSRPPIPAWTSGCRAPARPFDCPCNTCFPRCRATASSSIFPTDGCISSRADQGGNRVVETDPISVGKIDLKDSAGSHHHRQEGKKSHLVSAQVAGRYLTSRRMASTPPAFIPPGPDNPLGEYAMRLNIPGGSYLIHGTNKPVGVGMQITHGCIRLYPEDIQYLFGEVPFGMTVRIVNQRVKTGSGRRGGAVPRGRQALGRRGPKEGGPAIDGAHPLVSSCRPPYVRVIIDWDTAAQRKGGGKMRAPRASLFDRWVASASDPMLSWGASETVGQKKRRGMSAAFVLQRRSIELLRYGLLEHTIDLLVDRSIAANFAERSTVPGSPCSARQKRRRRRSERRSGRPEHRSQPSRCRSAASPPAT